MSGKIDKFRICDIRYFDHNPDLLYPVMQHIPDLLYPIN